MGQFTQAQCMMACQQGQVPPGIETCVCNAGSDCGTIFQQCANMGTSNGPGPGPGTGTTMVGPGPGVSSSNGVGGGGTGGGLPMGCSDCANNAFNGACGMQAQACEGHQGCVDLINCESSCNFDPMCVDGCKMQHGPNSNMLAAALLQCAVCEQCSMECANTDLFTVACTLPP
jgi:hypothetical protein